MKHAMVWTFILLLGWASPALAQTDVTAPAVQMLQGEGYKVSEVRRTWLGRILIVAKKGQILREVVLNRRSGAILNDQVFNASPDSNMPSNPTGMDTPDPGDMGGPGGGSGPGGGPGGGGPGGGGSGPGGF